MKETRRRAARPDRCPTTSSPVAGRGPLAAVLRRPRRLEPSLGAYVALLVVDLFLPLVAVFDYVAIAIYLIVPIRRPTRR
jgi:hypothetical protein